MLFHNHHDLIQICPCLQSAPLNQLHEQNMTFYWNIIRCFWFKSDTIGFIKPLCSPVQCWWTQWQIILIINIIQMNNTESFRVLQLLFIIHSHISIVIFKLINVWCRNFCNILSTSVSVSFSDSLMMFSRMGLEGRK